jgi:TonB-dependent SusC/RagA subfamily outer membrane receptor
VSGTNEPLLIVDGVRVDARQYDLALYSGTSVAPSRLDDLAPEDIERIEILSGAAAALYGAGASNGVILVTTKSGGSGPLRLSARATWDASTMPDVFPANYVRSGILTSTGTPTNT